MARYNGHPTYAHWNAALWFGNDEGLYRLARGCPSPAQLQAHCEDAGFTETPDGVKLTPALYRYAWKSVRE